MHSWGLFCASDGWPSGNRPINAWRIRSNWASLAIAVRGYAACMRPWASSSICRSRGVFLMKTAAVSCGDRSSGWSGASSSLDTGLKRVVASCGVPADGVRGASRGMSNTVAAEASPRLGGSWLVPLTKSTAKLISPKRAMLGTGAAGKAEWSLTRNGAVLAIGSTIGAPFGAHSSPTSIQLRTAASPNAVAKPKGRRGVTITQSEVPARK